MTETATLVALEHGSGWPSWLKPKPNSRVAIVAQYFETPQATLLSQVAERITELSGLGWRVDRVVLVTNGRTFPDQVAARAVLARGLLAHFAHAGAGQLVLTADPRTGPRSSAQLKALGQAIAGELTEANVECEVRFGRQRYFVGPSGEAYADFARAS